MSPTLIAALVADQAAWHTACRAQEFIEFDGIDSKMTVQCSCNVRLVLTVPKTPDPTETLRAPVTINMTVMPGGEVGKEATSGIFVTPKASKGDSDA